MKDTAFPLFVSIFLDMVRPSVLVSAALLILCLLTAMVISPLLRQMAVFAHWVTAAVLLSTLIFTFGVLVRCNDAALEQSDEEWRVHGDPMEAALLIAAMKAELNTEHKPRLVSLLQTDGAIVAMTGDGVNDAPALIKQEDRYEQTGTIQPLVFPLRLDGGQVAERALGSP